MLKRILKIFKVALWVVILALLLLVSATFLPIKGNFKAFVVQSGSMEPAIRTGSLIFVKPSASYEVGDIVNIKDGNNSVTHRVIGKSESGGQISFETKGDANEEADAQLVPESKIFGKMIWGLPLVGYPVGYAKTRMGFLFLVIIPAVIIIYEEMRKIKTEIAAAWERRKNKNQTQVGKVTFEEGFVRPSQAENFEMADNEKLRQLERENRPRRRKIV